VAELFSYEEVKNDRFAQTMKTVARELIPFMIL